jgi:hypothetical protein
MDSFSLSLNGLQALTDDVGMFQHTKFSTIMRKEGYTTDDNARALIAVLRYNQVFNDQISIDLAKKYLAFILHMQKEDGRFHNILGFDRSFKDITGSEDCMGHALWACGYTLCSKSPVEMKQAAKEVFDLGLPVTRLFTSPRAKAFAVLGLCHYSQAFPKDQNLLNSIRELTNKLKSHFNDEADEGWQWFEAYLTYANARIPQSLFQAYNTINDSECLQIAISSLDFLIKTQIIGHVFIPIGTNGWFLKNNKRAIYDQQPIEASCMVDAAVEAYKATKKQNYKEVAKTAFDWYNGNNSNKIKLINGDTHICYDGLTPVGLNKNQGAESTLSYYLAYLTLLENKMIHS